MNGLRGKANKKYNLPLLEKLVKKTMQVGG